MAVGGNGSTLVETGPIVVPPSITSSNSDAITQGVPDEFTVTTTGTPIPSITETGSLPTGVTFTDNGDGTASLAGTATASGTYSITISAENEAGELANQTFTFTVNPPVTTWTQQSPGCKSWGHGCGIHGL